MNMTKNQKRILRAFQATGTITLSELRKVSPYWNQGVQALIRMFYVERARRDDAYNLTREGQGALAALQSDEQRELDW